MLKAKENIKFIFALYGTTLMVFIVLALLIPKGVEVIAVNGIHTQFLDNFFAGVTNFGHGLILVPILLWTLFSEFRKSLVLLVAALVHGLLVFLSKEVLFPDTLRPASVLDKELLHFVQGVDVHNYSSFPSGHTATIFTAIILLSLFLKRKEVTIMLLVFGLLVGVSRIYLIQHFLMDVVGGALVGSVSVILSVLVFNPNKNWPTWMSQRIKFQWPFPKRRSSLSTR